MRSIHYRICRVGACRTLAAASLNNPNDPDMVNYLAVTATSPPPMPMKTKRAARDFTVVCVGGSAGGLDAYIRLLRHLPDDMGVAIVIVNHLRTVATLLHEILPRYTTMPVELITDKLLIRPNRVFIIPEQRDLHVCAGEFRLEPISKPRGWPDVISVFLRSRTHHWDGQLIAIIVSGYDIAREIVRIAHRDPGAGSA